MLKKIIFTLILKISIFNYSSYSMEIEEGQNEKNFFKNKVTFIEKKPQDLTGLQTKIMFKQGSMELHDLVFENGGDVVSTRNFQPIYIDYSTDFLDDLYDDTVIHGTWSESHNAWFFLHPFTSPIVKSCNKNHMPTKGITFFVKEIKEDTKEEDNIIIFQNKVKFIEKKPENLTSLQVKIMFLHGSFSLKSSVEENGAEVIKARTFMPVLLDGNIKALNEQNDLIINGTWVGSDKAWLFKYSPDPTQGVLFWVKEVIF